MLAELVQRLRESRGIAHKRDIDGVARLLERTQIAGQPPVLPGDDCAAIPDRNGFLLLSIEGFLNEFVSSDPWFAGYCAVMVNASDIYAMGGRPIAVVDALWAISLEAANYWDASTHSPTNQPTPERLRDDLEILPRLAEDGLCRAAKDISMGGVVGSALMLLECSRAGATIRTFTLPDGTKRYSITSYFPDIVDGTVCGFTSQVADVTPLKVLEFELMAANARAEFLETHDFLTGLPNRVLLMDNIRDAIARVRQDGGIFGVIAIDMDGFKSINDNYGHGVGDLTLKEVAERMQGAIRAIDTATRLGGDEFICLVNDVHTVEEIVHAMNRLLYAVCKPIQFEAAIVNPRLSCGIALFPANGATEAELVDNADAALYRAKKQGKNRVAFADVFV